MRDVEQELFNTIKQRLLPKAQEDGFMGDLSADALLLTMAIEQVKTDVVRNTFIELISLAFLAPEKFFAISKVIQIVIMMGGDNE
jgi:hypothetical protein